MGPRCCGIQFGPRRTVARGSTPEWSGGPASSTTTSWPGGRESFQQPASRSTAGALTPGIMRKYSWRSEMTTPSPPNPTPLPALAMLAAVVFVVGAIAAVVVFDRDPGLFRSRGSTRVSPAASASQADPPPDHMDRNGQFLWRLSAQGLQLRRTNDAAINDARRVCTRYASRESEQQIIQDMLAGSPGMSLNTASGFADTAISVYCPDGYIDHP